MGAVGVSGLSKDSAGKGARLVLRRQVFFFSVGVGGGRGG